jgi:hypothetical protein
MDTALLLSYAHYPPVIPVDDCMGLYSMTLLFP